MKNFILLEKKVPKKIFNRIRIDKVLPKLFPIFSRNYFKKCINKNYVLVNNIIITSPNFKIMEGDILNIKIFFKQEKFFLPQKIKLNIVYEDTFLLIINKPSSLVVHPGYGNSHNTLLNGLIFYYKNIITIPQNGIVHRLDKDTTGLIIIAKTISTYFILKKMIKLRKIYREYDAIVLGKIKFGGMINAPIKRHKFKRTHMTVSINGKTAITHYKIKKKFNTCTWLKVKLETGRTHQIRVHMLYIKHPIVGDKKYKYYLNFFKDLNNSKLYSVIKSFPRQALHASKLKFFHPITNKKMYFKINLPQDMINLIYKLNVEV
ncbi:23S rRNA pseudouridine(1911/1915/1917) synthase RluD [Buchnera aphidicola]|uniref:23S rRNA pseudouridine(1911/1915/1917) synthase RluD n=1 Tax=Buchnera aphidicola TaxID=9 RepID=UPI002237A74B|nr:23S rRNA pseudouridine(1911/1915/1917) synthase RluD [Buchnera aphidicola]MCW5197562.1 23S rRNA pseudouridine(1911/1915/1917) synthase RluD [Buchnera aphidicola (Chaitophorus viminalis)]